MNNKRKRTLTLSTFLLVLCMGIVVVFSVFPSEKKVEKLEIYQIIFDTSGGSKIDIIEVTEGKKVDKPQDPIREGYLFVGWLLNDEVYDFNSKVEEDITLEAQWQEIQPEVNYYLVSFDTSGGSSVNNFVGQEGTNVIKPVDPVKEGYKFEEWQYNGKNYDFSTPLKEDITLVALWSIVEEEKEPEKEPEKEEDKKEEKPSNEENKVKTYKVTFDSAGGSSVKTQTIQEGKLVTKPKDPQKAGYTFTGWTLNGRSYTFSNEVTKDITLKANWRKNEAPVVVVNKYTVNIYKDDGTKCDSQIVEAGKTVSIPSSCNNPIKSCYNFVGWNTSKNATSANFVPGTTKISKDISIYPAFKKIVYKAVCNEKGDNASTMNCVLSITADGKAINVDAIYINGKKVGLVMNVNAWRQFSGEITFDYNGNSGLTASKN